MTEDTEPASAPSKRPASLDDTVKTPPNKKVRLGFSTKDFRKDLKSDQKVQALQRFLQLITEDESQKCISTYVEQGGSALEILQTMDGESGVSPILVFDVVNRILLQISAKLSRYKNTAYDACRYLLSNYLTQINKMLGLSSSMNERLVVLKLLTTIVTCSVVLAKDVLLNVNFNPTNLELLTKVGEGKNEARTVFVHLIVAFLVDGHFPTFSVLMEKRGFMTSIISGLQFDKADLVVLVVTAMKNHILENSSVSKTVKMRIFNTQVIKDIVNLYNWKGAAGLHKNKKKSTILPVDEIDKSRVNEAVHSFLLVLCTSHKHGIVFKDHLIGFGKRQNSLMLTVLESLTRPWEHSYAGELVLKICRACPDLAKITWRSLKPSLAPRWTDKWLKAIEFAGKLVEEFEPDCIGYAIDGLNTQQLTQIVITLTSPLSIVSVLIPENKTFDTPATKYHVLSLLLKMAVAAEQFLIHAVDVTKFSGAISNHFSNNFPGINMILANWEQTDENFQTSDYLNVALDLLMKYKVLAPKMLEDGATDFDIRDLMSKTDNLDGETRLGLQVKTVDFFLDLEPSLFKPKMDLFRNVIMSTMECYCNSKDLKVFKVLQRVLQNSGAFDGCPAETEFWIDGFLNLKSFDTNVAIFLCDLVTQTEGNEECLKKVFDLKTNFSALILNLNDFCNVREISKAVKNYLNFVLVSIFHVQFGTTFFVEIVSQFSFLSDPLSSYFSAWNGLEVTVLTKLKGKLLEQVHGFSLNFLEGSLDSCDFELYPSQKLNILQTFIFYMTNLIKGGLLKEHHKLNSSKFLTFMINHNVFEDDRCVRAILGHPLLLSNFTKDDFSTRFVLDVVKSLKHDASKDFLSDYRRRVVSAVTKMLKKSEKHQDDAILSEILETLHLEYHQCYKLLSKAGTCADNKFFFVVGCYCLNRMADLGKSSNFDPLTNEIVDKLTRLLSTLLSEQFPNVHLLSSAFLKYLNTFPQNVEGVNVDLFDSLVATTEFNKENLLLCEFLLDRKSDYRERLVQSLDEVCSKRSFILALLDVILKHYINDSVLLEKIFNKIEPHIVKALQKPHKAGQHFQNRYHSLGILVEKFMKTDGFGKQVQKFETTELFHVYLLKKIYDKVEKTQKIWTNMIMTFVHMITSLLKQKAPKDLEQIGVIFLEFMRNVGESFDGTTLENNESLKMFCKLCLKHGISDNFVLLQLLSEVVHRCVGEEDGKLILEMLFSHSQFLELILGDSHKRDLVNLWKVICTKWPILMERNHIPVLLASYKATKGEAGTLELIKMYESKPEQTKFFDFKPFLWGHAAASHYSVRSEPHKVLWRQPKVADVLNSLNPSTIVATITAPSSPDSYDLDYFLALFSQLLAPENPVPTYRFTKTGALALTLTGLRGDKNQRLATCHVLQRFYFHLEARQSGKDHFLWLRLVEAVCKGIAVLDDFEINNFVGVFLARTALIMTQPTDSMYVPLSQYLAAKDSLDFRTIPELYTFLHSPHVDSSKHKTFILEVLRDGLKEEKDFTALLKSMGFKLISELCSSTVCEVQTKILILDIFEQCCQIESGVKILCGSLSFLSQIATLILCNLNSGIVLVKLLAILLKIAEIDSNRHRNFLIYFSLTVLWEDERYSGYLTNCKGTGLLHQVLMVIHNRYPEFFTSQQMRLLDAR